MSEKTKVVFDKLEKPKPIYETHPVRVTKMKHIVEILSLAVEPSSLLKIKKLSKYEYVELETGEVFQYKINENRSQNIAGLKDTFKKIRNLINNNFTGASNELFVTLSYAENMTDTKRLYKDFDVFMKRFRRKYKNIDYMSVVEPQGRGAWHCHVLIRFNDKKNVYLSNNDEISPLWGHGFTKTKSLKNVDNIGAYLNAYLSDVEICEENSQTLIEATLHSKNAYENIETQTGEEKTLKNNERIDLRIVEKEVLETDGSTVKKKYLKGARLFMYPSGMNLYRCSRGIVKPKVEKMSYKEAKKIVGSEPANYSRTIDLLQDERLINSITYEQYNLKRNKKQQNNLR